MIDQTSASTSSYPFLTRSFANLSLDLIVGSIRRSECGPARLHFLLHSSYWVPPAALPFRVFSGKALQVPRRTSTPELASTRGRMSVSTHSGSSVGCSVIAATEAVMNPSCTSMTPGPGACGLRIWSVIGGSVMATIAWYVLGGDTIGIGTASLGREAPGKRSRHRRFTTRDCRVNLRIHQANGLGSRIATRMENDWL